MLGILQERCLSQSNEIRTLKDQLLSAERKLQVIMSGYYMLHGLCMTYGLCTLSFWNEMVEPLAHHVG